MDTSEVRYRVADFLHGLIRANRSACRTMLKNLFYFNEMGLIVTPPLLDGSKMLNNRIGEPSFAFNTADTGSGATFTHLVLRLFR